MLGPEGPIRLCKLLSPSDSLPALKASANMAQPPWNQGPRYCEKATQDELLVPIPPFLLQSCIYTRFLAWDTCQCICTGHAPYWFWPWFISRLSLDLPHPYRPTEWSGLQLTLVLAVDLFCSSCWGTTGLHPVCVRALPCWPRCHPHTAPHRCWCLWLCWSLTSCFPTASTDAISLSYVCWRPVLVCGVLSSTHKLWYFSLIKPLIQVLRQFQ